ncbi:MAG: membrane dipeptidase [Planctomycetota bacterium]
MFIIDAHLDLSLNALDYNRDLRKSVAEIRSGESGMDDLKGRRCGTVAFPEMRKAGIGLCVATQIAGCMKPPGPVAVWDSPEQAWASTRGQLAWYRAMEQVGQMRQVCDTKQLDHHVEQWLSDPADTPIGYVLSLEGADSLRTLDDLHTAHGEGLRALGPAHYGVGRYAFGHDCEGPFPACGLDLLREMDHLKMILDATHLSEACFWQALEQYESPIWASHHNCRALVDDPRQLSDQQILALIERDAVIGMAFDVWMVVPGWKRGVTQHTDLPSAHMSDLVDHVDHICQLAGNCHHVGIGTDLDGGYGTEQTPADLDTIADLETFMQLVRDRGYGESDIEAICHGNFLRFLRSAL